MKIGTKMASAKNLPPVHFVSNFAQMDYGDRDNVVFLTSELLF